MASPTHDDRVALFADGAHDLAEVVEVFIRRNMTSLEQGIHPGVQQSDPLIVQRLDHLLAHIGPLSDLLDDLDTDEIHFKIFCQLASHQGATAPGIPRYGDAGNMSVAAGLLLLHSPLLPTGNLFSDQLIQGTFCRSLHRFLLSGNRACVQSDLGNAI